MPMDHAMLRRPVYWLAIAMAALAILSLTACGSAAQSESAAPKPAEQSQTATGNNSAQDVNPQTAATSTGSRSGDAGHSDHASGNSAVPPDAVMINVPIVGRATTLTREDLRVSQGDTVHLTFSSDEPGEVHLHGYDLTAPVSPDQPGALTFEAATAGAFGINFHIFDAESMSGSDHADDHDHGESSTIVSEVPISVSITAEPDGQGGVDVNIATEGFRFAPDLVDQPHASGVGHAHIYLNGVKLGRVFESHYHIADLEPGQNVIRVSLNSNDHSELTYDGAPVESTAIVVVPNAGQASNDDHSRDDHDHQGHDHEASAEIVAEVHLGNLEVYP